MKIRMKWTCSNYKHHQHRWRWTAWLCGRWQYFIQKLSKALTPWQEKEDDETGD